jgi:hypothetical protein
LVAEGDYRRTSDGVATGQRPYHPKITAASDLVNTYEIMEAIPLRWLNPPRQYGIAQVF